MVCTKTKQTEEKHQGDRVCSQLGVERSAEEGGMNLVFAGKAPSQRQVVLQLQPTKGLTTWSSSSHTEPMDFETVSQ